jgi:Ca-activated chloride channel family protein
MSNEVLRFANPGALALLWAVPGVVGFYLFAFRRKRRALERLGNPELIARLVASASRPRQAAKAALSVLTLVLFVLALARPQFGTRLELVKRKGVDLIIALDVSKSMLAEDLKPNRLEQAKREVAGLIDHLEGDRIGLIAFAGTAFMQCPLTLDYGAAKMFLDLIDPSLIPVPGTAIGEAIRLATRSFDPKERQHKVLILVTDGEDHDTEPVKAAEEAKKEGVVIYTIALGDPRIGAPVPELDEEGRRIGSKRDREGKLVMSKANTETLNRIAYTTNGKSHVVTPRGLDLDKVYADIARLDEKELQSRKFTQYEERYQWPLTAGVLLLTLEWILTDRRRPRRRIES